MQPLSVLLIDDHEIVRAGIELLVRQRLPAAKIESFAGLGEAVDRGPQAPSIIVLDLNLKGISREPALTLIKAHWPHAQIIILTAEQDQAVLDAIRRAGIRQLVGKSDPPERLLEVLETVAAEMSSDPADDRPSIAPLSRRQIEVLRHLRQGLPNKAIARLMGLSEFTVRGHVQQIIKATGATNRSHAVFLAVQAGLL